MGYGLGGGIGVWGWDRVLKGIGFGGDRVLGVG